MRAPGMNGSTIRMAARLIEPIDRRLLSYRTRRYNPVIYLIANAALRRALDHDRAQGCTDGGATLRWCHGLHRRTWFSMYEWLFDDY